MSKFLEPIYCPCAKVKKLDRILTRGQDAVLSASGLTASQFSTLRLLERVGPIVITEFAKLMAMDRSSLSRNLKIMDKAGWLTLTPYPRDIRNRLITITAKGTRLHHKAKKDWEMEQRFLLKAVGQRKLLELNAMITEVAALIEAGRNK